MEVLALNQGKVMLGAELLSKVWGAEYHDDLQYLRVWISRLRDKLGRKVISTIPGIGYKLVYVPGTEEDEEPENLSPPPNQHPHKLHVSQEEKEKLALSTL